MLLLRLNHRGISHKAAKLRSFDICVRQRKVIANSPKMAMVTGLQNYYQFKVFGCSSMEDTFVQCKIFVLKY